MSGFTIFVMTLLVLIVVTIISTAKIVPQGFNYTVQRLGRYVRTLQPGLSIIVPFIETIGDKVDMRERVLDIPTQEVITKDNAMVTVDAVAFFQVIDAPQAAYEVSNLTSAMLNLTMTNIRTVMGSLDLDEALSKRNEINAQLLHIVDEATNPWGVKVTRIEIKDIDPPENLVNAMARQMIAEREKRASILEAEGARQSAILKAEGEKQAEVLSAEGRKEAAFRDAEARERSAQAEAEATRMVSDAIASGDIQAINYFVANNYVGALKDLAAAPNQKVLMLPVDAAGIIGAVGGIAEITREAFAGSNGGQDNGDKARRPANRRGSVPSVSST
ncbi:MAG: SPFH/Band 7/PHB domain protein [Hyphomicrobiales bacterium]|nr:SPFH/Band 7/PHB domain protein [Hyphomicrobiales bacterium]